MSITDKKIFELLPAVYRMRDAEQGKPLEALMSIIAREAKLTEKNIAELYNNWFIETCSEWVVPYIGDLLGVRPLNKISGSAAVSQRGYVANTISYRRRKGITPVLEQLCADVTGWRSHAVEFFEKMIATQYMNHIRLHCKATPDLRKMNACDLVNTAFDPLAHSADIRHISSGRGKYNIPNIGLFVWRLQHYPIVKSDAGKALFSGSPTTFFTFDPTGNNLQLFNDPQTETSITHLSTELNVPGTLRRRALFDELEARRQAIVNNEEIVYSYFDNRLAVEDDPSSIKHPVFEIYKNGEPNPVPPEEILICNLEKECTPVLVKSYPQKQSDGIYLNVDMKITVVVDPVNGRFIFTDPGSVTTAIVSYAYGFSGDLGSGPFSRQASIVSDFQQKNFITGGVEKSLWQCGVSKTQIPVFGEQIYKTINEAIDEWKLQPAGTRGVILIMDNATYEEDFEIDILEGSSLLLAAADWPVRKSDELGIDVRTPGDIAADELRPLITGDITVNGIVDGKGAAANVDKKTGGGLTLNGLLVKGKLEVAQGNLGLLNIDYCTLIPGNGGLVIGADVADPLSDSNQWLSVSLVRTIAGGVRLFHTSLGSLAVTDCIISHEPAAIVALRTSVQLNNTTVWGTVSAKIIEASNCIFNDTVRAEQRQTGCIRFSFVPIQSTETPRRYRCQPDIEIEEQIEVLQKIQVVQTSDRTMIKNKVAAWLTPVFSSVFYGHHAFAQLSHTCPAEISAGADNGAEMGAYYFLMQPQRIANLRIALDEYLPLGMEAGVFFAT
ncbi:MAG: hypothetical protein NTW29_06945 [Bacteroidetes bacterium]|nr:hypothetical protein [Bacteroidota bacterium]